MKKSKQFLSVLLSVLMIACLLMPISAEVSGIAEADAAPAAEKAEETATDPSLFQYTTDDYMGTARITGFSRDYEGDVIIPETLDGYTVTELGLYESYGGGGVVVTGMYEESEMEAAPIAVTTVSYEPTTNFPDAFSENGFAGCTGVTSVVLPSGLKKINSNAFAGCDALKSVTVQSAVSFSSFENLPSLEEINIIGDDTGLCSIDGVVFSIDGTMLYRYPAGRTESTYTIPSSVSVIDDNAFANASHLQEITIPENVKRIYSYAFSGCTSLTAITLPENVDIYSEAFSDTAYVADPANWEDGLLYCGSHLLASAEDIAGSCTVRDGTTSIADNVFYGRENLTEVILPDGLKTIGDSVFCNCTNLSSIRFPDSVEAVDSWTLSGTAIQDEKIGYEDGILYAGHTIVDVDPEISGEVTIPDGVTYMPGGVFSYCENLTSITLPDSLTEIPYDAFYGCTNLETVNLPENLTAIGDDAFGETALMDNESLWEDGVLYLGTYLIQAKDTVTGNYTVKDGTTIIADNAFDSCNKLTGVTLPASLKNLQNQSFYACESLSEVNLQDTQIESIGNYAFYGCSDLTTVTLPETVNSIGSFAFAQCETLGAVSLPDSLKSLGEYAFDGTAYTADSDNWTDDALYLDNALLQMAEDADADSFTVRNGTSLLATHVFSENYNLKHIVLSPQIDKLDEKTFYNCGSLERVDILNPDCDIAYVTDIETAWEITIPIHVAIGGYPGSTAEAYAKTYGNEFILLGDFPDEPIPDEPTTEKPTTDKPTTPEPSTAAPTTGTPTTKEPTPVPTTQKADSSLVVKDDTGITILEEKDVVSAAAVDNKGYSVAELKAKFGNESIAIVSKDGETLADDARVGTGSVIQVLDQNGEAVSTYTVLVPMDVNGDAAITAQDARVVLRTSAMLEKPEGVYRLAANADADDEGRITAQDARRILRVSAKLEK